MPEAVPLSTGSGELKSPIFIAQFFDSLQEAQIANAREIEQLKTILAVHGKNLEETIASAKELFDLRTTMVNADYDRINAQFREVSAVFQQSIERLNDSIDDRFLRFEKKIDSIHQADMQITTARITRVQAIIVATLVFAGVIATSITTALVTLATRAIH